MFPRERMIQEETLGYSVKVPDYEGIGVITGINPDGSSQVRMDNGEVIDTNRVTYLVYIPQQKV